MQIIIDGKEAVLKQGSSFDFIAENRLFSGSDAYTLSISFPLRDCQQNIDIFGHMYRSELPIDDYVFDCEIRDRAFSRFGTLTIVEISDIDVKGQFLEGRSEQNFAKDFDEKYINELPLGPGDYATPQSATPERAWNPASNNYAAVALPWVSADSGVTHNFADYDSESGSYSWNSDVRDITYLPYLLSITSKICTVLGYRPNLSEWKEHPWLSKIIICNVLPGSWDFAHYTRALPHWTIAEFFEKLELFLRGEFTIDHRAKTVNFRFTESVLSETPPVQLERVVDEYSVAVSSDGADCNYQECLVSEYSDADHQMWNFMSCPWFLESIPPAQIIHTANVGNIVQNNLAYLSGGVPDGDNLAAACLRQVFHATSTDEYFMLRHVGREYSSAYSRYHNFFVLQPLNECGPSEYPSEKSSVQLDFVPACIDFTESKYGMALFVDFNSYSEVSPDDDDSKKSEMQRMIEAGETSDAPEYFKSIMVAFYDGSFTPGQLPSPKVSNIVIHPEKSPSEMVERLDFSFRLNNPSNPHRKKFHNIDRTRKVTFKFLADDIPDPRAVFYIKGRRYICEKITATFTEDGMSQLLKGEFWPLLDP